MNPSVCGMDKGVVEEELIIEDGDEVEKDTALLLNSIHCRTMIMTSERHSFDSSAADFSSRRTGALETAVSAAEEASMALVGAVVVEGAW